MKRKLGYILLIIFGSTPVVVSFTYWILNPHLTQMEVFLELWWLFLIPFILIVIILLNDSVKNKLK